jgi:phosphatidylglycerophosphate synthase
LDKPRYVYQSAQHSILRPYYQRWIWIPLLRFIPASISPNALTGLSTVSAAASFFLAAVGNSSALAMVGASLCVFIYLCLDNMDGAHARNTDQSSPLGEFLDHWLDTLNNGFIIVGACIAVDLSPFFTLLVLSAGTLAFFAVQLELRYTGVFRMGRVADIEGNTAVSGLYLLVALLGPEFFAWAPAEGWPSLAVLLGSGVIGQAAWTLVSALWRLDTGYLDGLPIVLCLAALIAWGAGVTPGPSPGLEAALLTACFFVNPVFTGRPILARLRGLSTAKADAFALAMVLAASGASIAGFANPGLLAWMVAAVLAAMTLRYAHLTIAALHGQDPVPGSGEAGAES